MKNKKDLSIPVSNFLITDAETGKEICETSVLQVNPMTLFSEHQQRCDKCPAGGPIANPNPDEYCEEGFILLKNMIEYIQNMNKMIFGM